LYALVDADATASIRALETHAFRLADVRLTFDRAVGAVPTLPVEPAEPGLSRAADAWAVEDATARDATALRALARASHTGTRFTDDPGFDRDRAAELYAVWIANALVERDASVIVCRGQEPVAGYLSLHAQSRPEATIGLVAVSETARNSGIGQALVGEALRRARAHGAARVSVVTQGRNAASIRFYERCGFQARRCQLWYHRWAAR
jgi:ribosomal protein S18 acetylase RimI-like enzyme